MKRKAPSNQPSLFADDEPPHAIHTPRAKAVEPQRVVRCRALGCVAGIKHARLMCAHHWAMTPQHVQDRVWKHYKPGQEWETASAEYFLAAALAVEAVAKLEGQEGANLFRARYEELARK